MAAEPIFVGIVVGLVVGKPLGIVGATWLVSRPWFGGLPRTVTWPPLVGAATVAGHRVHRVAAHRRHHLRGPGSRRPSWASWRRSILASLAAWVVFGVIHGCRPRRSTGARARGAAHPRPPTTSTTRSTTCGPDRRAGHAGRVRRLRMPLLRPGRAGGAPAGAGLRQRPALRVPPPAAGRRARARRDGGARRRGGGCAGPVLGDARPALRPPGRADLPRPDALRRRAGPRRRPVRRRPAPGATPSASTGTSTAPTPAAPPAPRPCSSTAGATRARTTSTPWRRPSSAAGQPVAGGRLTAGQALCRDHQPHGPPAGRLPRPARHHRRGDGLRGRARRQRHRPAAAHRSRRRGVLPAGRVRVRRLRPRPRRDRRRARPGGRALPACGGGWASRSSGLAWACSKPGPLRARPAAPLARGRPGGRHPRAGQQPRRPAAAAEWFGVEHHHLPIDGGDKAGQEARVRRARASTASTWWCSPATCRSSRPSSATSGRAASSTSTTRSCPRSWAPAPTTRPTSGGQDHRGDGALRHRRARRRPHHRPGRHRVSHRDDVADLQRKGRDLEVAVLARAVRAHIEHRTLVYGRRTVVFD